MTEQVVKSKDLRRQTKEWIANFSQTVWEMFNRKSCKYMCNNFTKQKGKKFQLHIIDQSFGHNGMGISYQKKVGKPWREKGGAHFMQAWCQKDLPTLYQRRTGRQTHVMWTPRDHLDYRRRDNIQRSSPQNTGRAKTVTTLRLEECDFGHALGARTFYTSPLRKCQKTYRKTFWLLIFKLFNVNWIMNNTLSFAKGFLNN